MTAVRNRLHQKNKALSKGDPSRTRSMQDIVLKHQQCNGCYMCQVPTPNRRNRIAKQGRPSAESTECQHLIDGFHFLPDDFKFFLVLLAELCNRKAFRIETDKLTSRFSWVLRFEINMFNLPLLLLHVFEAGQHGSQRISKKLLDFDLASQSREKTWLPFGVNRSRKKPDPPPEVQISRRTTWNEKISTSTLHTLQILAMKPPWSCGNSESQSSSCTFDADHSDTQWHDGDIHVTFITRLEEAPLLARVSMSLSEHSFPRKLSDWLVSPDFPLVSLEIFFHKKWMVLPHLSKRLWHGFTGPMRPKICSARGVRNIVVNKAFLPNATITTVLRVSFFEALTV